MKKHIVTILIIFGFLIHAYSENVFSLSVVPSFTAIQYNAITGGKEYDYHVTDFELKLGFDYKYIFQNNIMLGAQVSLQPDSFTFYSTDGGTNGVVLTASGLGITFAPIVGYRFGKRHLQGLEFLPIVISSTSFSGDATATKRVGNLTAEEKGSISGDKTIYATELRANIQFGNNLVRNGFVAGIGYTWLVDMSSVRLLQQETVFSNAYNCSGIFIEVGYKLSFVK